jgi:hypothetical protein
VSGWSAILTLLSTGFFSSPLRALMTRSIAAFHHVGPALSIIRPLP